MKRIKFEILNEFFECVLLMVNFKEKNWQISKFLLLNYNLLIGNIKLFMLMFYTSYFLLLRLYSLLEGFI